MSDSFFWTKFETVNGFNAGLYECMNDNSQREANTAVLCDVEHDRRQHSHLTLNLIILTLPSCMMLNMLLKGQCHYYPVWCGIWHKEKTVTVVLYDVEYGTERPMSLLSHMMRNITQRKRHSCLVWCGIWHRGQCHYYPVWCAIWHKETSVTILSCMMWNKAQKGQCHSCLVWCRIWHREANVTAVLYDAE